MELRKLGKSELEVPIIIFGAWAIGGWLWGGTDDEKAVSAIHKALDLGMTCIDTAPVYGFGHSEEIVGRAIKGRRDDVIIATKCGLRWDLEEGELFFETIDSRGKALKIYRNLKAHSIKEECELSLKRLSVDVIDLYQCHWPDSTTSPDETMETLLRLKEEGKIRAIGVSNFTTEMIKTCLKYGDVASDQPKYSLLFRDIEKDILPYCRKHDIGLIVYGPLGQGLLTGKVTMERKFNQGDLRIDQPWFQPKNRRRILDTLEKIKPIAKEHNATLAQLSINWVISEPGVTSAIVGARNPEQVIENAGASDFRLSKEERSIIKGCFEALGEPEEE
ncbi:MAG TPA: aldo/keto reductase [Nitrospinota bacterium]|nr:aldo/keto reductase [Nitrospinota bacterium]